MSRSVARSASSAATADALYVLILLHLRLGNAADAGRVEVGLLSLHTPQTAQLEQNSQHMSSTKISHSAVKRTFS
jgi:hypothetical protein